MNAKPIEVAIVGPATLLAYVPASTRNSIPVCCPNVLMIVPINKLANKPCAIALVASIP